MMPLSNAKSSILVFGATVMTFLFGHVANSQTVSGLKADTAGPFAVYRVTIDHTMQPKNVGDVVVDIAKNPTASAMLATALAYYGVPPQYTKGALAVASATSTNRSQELQQLSVLYPPGYTYCRSTVTVISTVPSDRENGAGIEAYAFEEGIDVWYWAKRLQLGEGRSWVDATIDVVAIKKDQLVNSIAKGACLDTRNSHPNSPIQNKLKIVSCRGNQGDSAGRSPCGSHTR